MQQIRNKEMLQNAQLEIESMSSWVNKPNLELEKWAKKYILSCREGGEMIDTAKGVPLLERGKCCPDNTDV